MSVPDAEALTLGREPSPLASRVAEWWRTTLSDSAGDRGIRATLCRCRSPLDAVTVPAVLGLARRLGRVPAAGDPLWKQRGFERVLTLGIVLAAVRKDHDEPLLRRLGWGQFPYQLKETEAKEGRPILSELRFKRLLQTDGEDELIAAFRRLVALAGGETSVRDLAQVLLNWDYPRTQRDLALTYYRANTYGLSQSDSSEDQP